MKKSDFPTKPAKKAQCQTKEDDCIFKFEMSFFKILHKISKVVSIYIQIPETIILGYGFNSPTLFATDNITGELIINEGLSKEAIEESFIYFAEQENEQTFPIAIFKTGISTDQDHCKVLFNSRECMVKWEETCSTGKAMQRYVRNGNTLAIIRATWDSVNCRLQASEIVKHKNIRAAHEAIKKSASSLKRNSILNEMTTKANRDLFQILENDKEFSSTAYMLTSLERKMMYLVNLFERYFLRDNNLKIISLDADWIEDEQGKLNLISVKKYRIGEVEVFKSSITLFNIPKVEISSFVPNKPRQAINLRKKMSGSSMKSFLL